MKQDFIKIPVYWAEVDGKPLVDEDSIREEFELKLKEVIKEYER